MPSRTLELRFPAAGVVRRSGFRDSVHVRAPYPSPWAVNVRLEDPFARRLRGGSRSGLTKFREEAVGTTIAGMVGIQTSSTSGTEEMLVVLVDGTIAVMSGSRLTLSQLTESQLYTLSEDELWLLLAGDIFYPLVYLLDESGSYIVTEAGDKIVMSTADAPSSGFLVGGKQHVYVIGSTGVVQMDPRTGLVVDLTPTAGTVPLGCTLGCVYRDCLFLAGGDNAAYKSQQADFTNWDFSTDVSNTSRAMAFQLSGASAVGAIPTALVPHEDEFLLLATARTLWVIRGNPAGDGSLRQVSETTGIVSSHAWCKVGDVIVFLAEDGIYQVGPDGSGLKSLSEDKLPEDLRNIDTATTSVLMGYDHAQRAVHIYLVTESGGDTHWLFELVPLAFWPMRVQDGHAPVAICRYGEHLLLGGSDGYVRYPGGDDDDGEDIESHVLIGPLRLGGPEDYGLLHVLHEVIAAGSGTVTLRVVAADTAEEAVAHAKVAIELYQSDDDDYLDYVSYSTSLAAGRAHRDYPRVRAMWACLWLQSTAKWAYESVIMDIMPFGKWR